MGARVGAAVLVLGVLALGRAWALLAAAGFIVALAWLWRLLRHPYGPCWGCRGRRRGRNRGSDEDQHGRCRTCGGTGERIRAGARMVHPGLRGK